MRHLHFAYQVSSSRGGHFTLLLALAGETGQVQIQDLSDPRPSYEPMAMFNSAPLFWALLMMNALGEVDVASLNRLRPQHAPFTLNGRRDWLLAQGFVRERRQGLVRYLSLNPEHPAHEQMKRLLDRIAEVWPDLVSAAEFNDDLKPALRLARDRKAKKKAAHLTPGTDRR